jgi:hypothetical protein
MLKQLETAYEAAIQEQARQRNREITPFDRQVSQSIFHAGLLAIADHKSNEPLYRVVSAPTGSGKSSYAQAFIKAYVEVIPDGSVLFLVETIRQAEDTYRDMSSLIGVANVAVWSRFHDQRPSANSLKHSGVIPQRRFLIEDLANYRVVIATHNFYSHGRADKATIYRGKPRNITFVDEKPEDVSIYDVDTGLLKTVRDRIGERINPNLKHVEQLTILHDHLEAAWQSSSTKALDEIPEMSNVDLSWFTTDQANDFITSSDDQVRSVFGFGRALAKGFAFLSRYSDSGKGARFVGYEMKMPLAPGTILLDATADIDGMSLLVKNRQPVAVPSVDFSNLAIGYIEPELPDGLTVAQVLRQARHARLYASWILETIVQNSQPGELVLAVVHKALLDHEYLPNHRDFSSPFNLQGRWVCFINWGMGIGSNRWKNSTAVFLFGEFHIPKRAMVGTHLALKEEQATAINLAPYQSPNPNCGDLPEMRDGRLCRLMKQLAMRGNARNIDGDGVCGVQRLFVTGELDRLIRYKDRMFPGATLTSQPKQRGEKRGVRALLHVLYSTTASEITTIELQQLTGVSLQKNGKRYLSNPLVQRAMKDSGFSFHPGGGRGNPGRFVRACAVATAA